MHLQVLFRSLILSIFVQSLQSSTPTTKCRKSQFCRCSNKTFANTEYKVVECSDYNLDAIQPFLEDTSLLLRVDYSKNLIQHLTFRSFKGYENTEDLDLSKNKIWSIGNSTLDRLIRLQIIDLSDNALVDLSQKTFVGNVQLKNLDLSNNYLETLPKNVFLNNRNLEVMELSDNKISSLNSLIFKNLPHLQEIYLSNNQIKQLDKNIFNFQNGIASLSLHNNKLATPYRQWFDGNFVELESINLLDLSGNPWSCDCRMRDFQQWILNIKHRNLIHHLRPESHIKCAYPMGKKGVSLLELNQDYHFVCSSPVIRGLELREVHVQIGEKVSLECDVDANPRPMMSFGIPTGTGGKIELQSNYHGILHFSNYQVEDIESKILENRQSSRFSTLLHISNVTKEQNGVYTCDIEGLKDHCTDSSRTCETVQKQIQYKLVVNAQRKIRLPTIFFLFLFLTAIFCLLVKFEVVKSEKISAIQGCFDASKMCSSIKGCFDGFIRWICIVKRSRRNGSEGFAPLREEDPFSANLEGEELSSITREPSFRPKSWERNQKESTDREVFM